MPAPTLAHTAAPAPAPALTLAQISVEQPFHKTCVKNCELIVAPEVYMEQKINNAT